MAFFIYRAKDGPGRTIDGEINAESLTAAVASIDAMGYSPVWVREKDGQARRRLSSRRSVSQRDVTIFTRQLASLIKSGVPILRALTTIGDQTENGQFRTVIAGLESSIRGGSMLSDALTRYPRLFPELYVNMARSGEWGGVLDTILMRLADAREQEDETRRRVQSAMAYPVLVLAVGAATVFVLLAFFLPRVVELFSDFQQLPVPTRIMMGLTRFFAGNWHWVVIAGVLAVALFRRVVAYDAGRAWADRLKLRLPLVGAFVLFADIARFARTLGLLLNAGIAIDKALELSGATLRNSVLRGEITQARRGTVQQGATLSSGLRRSRHIPAFVANMTAVGEESGRLDESLNEIAAFYEREVEQRTRLVTSLIEPVLILVVGGMVGFIVAAMLLPIFRLGTGLQ
jgi:type IV pilus assembly protein PilC